MTTMSWRYLSQISSISRSLFRIDIANLHRHVFQYIRNICMSIYHDNIEDDVTPTLFNIGMSTGNSIMNFILSFFRISLDRLSKYIFISTNKQKFRIKIKYHNNYTILYSFLLTNLTLFSPLLFLFLLFLPYFSNLCKGIKIKAD